MTSEEVRPQLRRLKSLKFAQAAAPETWTELADALAQIARGPAHLANVIQGWLNSQSELPTVADLRALASATPGDEPRAYGCDLCSRGWQPWLRAWTKKTYSSGKSATQKQDYDPATAMRKTGSANAEGAAIRFAEMLRAQGAEVHEYRRPCRCRG